MTDDELPPLPFGQWTSEAQKEKVRAYARLAIEQDRARPVPGEDELERLIDDYAREVADCPNMPTPLERKVCTEKIERARTAALAAIRQALLGTFVAPCCEQFNTCEERCVPLVRHLRQALRSVPASEPVAEITQSCQLRAQVAEGRELLLLASSALQRHIDNHAPMSIPVRQDDSDVLKVNIDAYLAKTATATPPARHLRYHLLKAWDAGEKRLAREVMAELGITYKRAIPQTLGDQWWFVDCANVPDTLPPYITELDEVHLHPYQPDPDKPNTTPWNK